MLDFIEKVPIGDITGSEYNPRVITEDAIQSLQKSLLRFGMVKPLIVNAANNVIIAGHQRKKAALAIGMTELPCIRIKTPNVQDEIHFNLLHNSIETNQNSVILGAYQIGAYSYCPADKIRLANEPKNLLVCSEITRLISQYGEWGNVVTDGNGNVILNAEYAYCAKKLGYGVLSYAIANEDVEEFLAYIGIEYGRYNFDNLSIKTYHQFKAQMKRCSTDGRRLNTSTLYEKYLIPSLKKTDHIIDVGAGRMAYMRLVKSMGYDIHAYEPSLMAKGSNSLDMKGIIANILDAERAVKTRGLFDWTILEFVINSVVDDEFEKAVLILCNAATKADGTLLTCTRNLDGLMRMHDQKTCSGGGNIALRCLDEKNYALSIANGIAFKQKFHTRESYVALLMRYYEIVEVVFCDVNNIFCSCKRPRQLPREMYEEYLEKELNIEYPGGFKHNKHKGLMNALIARVEERYG